MMESAALKLLFLEAAGVLAAGRGPSPEKLNT
jgi:hypothetical protein